MQDSTDNAQPANRKDKTSALWFFVVLFFLVSMVEGVALLYTLGSNNDEAISENTEAVTNTSKLNLAYSPAPSPTVTPSPVIRSKTLNREFSFPLRDYEGNEVAQIKYLLKQYEFTKEVSVNFQKAKITNEKIILAIDIEITNDSNTAFEIIARDYLRLSINGEDKWLAPDMHADPVEVRPHSTKDTRVGFTINETDSNIKLQVGELDGEKEIVEIN